MIEKCDGYCCGGCTHNIITETFEYMLVLCWINEHTFEEKLFGEDINDINDDINYGMYNDKSQ